MKRERPTINVRYAEPSDLADVHKVESSSYIRPWTRDEMSGCLNRRNTVCLVAESGREVVGFIVFEVFKKRVQLLNMAVAPKHRRAGVGSALVDRVLASATVSRQVLIAAEVRESNLAAQLFLRSAGFKAVQILPQYYDDTHEDAYQFEFLARAKVLAVS